MIKIEVVIHLEPVQGTCPLCGYDNVDVDNGL